MAILRAARDKVPWATLKSHRLLDGATISRVIPREETKTKRGDEPPSAVAVERVRQALEELTGDEIPPPAIPITDADQWQWIQAGDVLRTANPDLYRTLLAAAMGVVEPTLLARRRVREAMEKIKRPPRKPRP